MTREHSAALAVLDKIAGYSWSINEYGRALVALPELAEAWRKGVELRRCAFEVRAIGDFDTYCHSKLVKAELAFDAALAAVADKLNGEGK